MTVTVVYVPNENYLVPEICMARFSAYLGPISVCMLAFRTKLSPVCALCFVNCTFKHRSLPWGGKAVKGLNMEQHTA